MGTLTIALQRSSKDLPALEIVTRSSPLLGWTASRLFFGLRFDFEFFGMTAASSTKIKVLP